MSKWWKCDLQVATPAWQFNLPEGETHDLASQEGRLRFAERYMDDLMARGVEVIALADHNTGTWIDLMVSVGRDKGIYVFPGCEVTTGSGADGIHLLVIGDQHRTSLDFDRLIHGELGFDNDHPPFHQESGRVIPGASRKTITAILDDLPDDLLAIAPHALTENGVASKATAKGEIRWRAIHHGRLCAVDPGDCSEAKDEGFNGRFRRRELDDFPRLPDLAFVSTSDAYSLTELGRRFTWIRMEEPSIEGLRQAFLDPKARIICDWDPRLAPYVDQNPNRIRHSWIEKLSIGGRLGNSTAPLSLSFNPGLNVLIGGRGSGKSTIIAALRHLYGNFDTLPERVRAEAVQFSEAIFEGASLEAYHRVANSQDEEVARWNRTAGSVTSTKGGVEVPTSFRVRVVNQKELFERVSRDPRDPLSASRSFLSFVDESLDLLRATPPKPGTWWHHFDAARQAWVTATQELQTLRDDLGQLPSIAAEVATLEGQIAAFDSEEAKARRNRNDGKLEELRALEAAEGVTRGRIARLSELSVAFGDLREATEVAPAELRELLVGLDRINDTLSTRLQTLARETMEQLEAWRGRVEKSDWKAGVENAQADSSRYLEELREKGVDSEAYDALKSRLSELNGLLRSLRDREAGLLGASGTADRAWNRIRELLAERRETRERLLQAVSIRSGRLKFELAPHKDTVGWVRTVRELLGLRADGFLDDVPALAGWLWQEAQAEERDRRWAAWREGLVKGSLGGIGPGGKLRPSFDDRLKNMDGTIRLLLASEIPDDVIEMSFLRDGGSPAEPGDWQEITQGSPGQRTAAMLGVVLHHGEEPLVLDQPEDDLDTEWISSLVVRELRECRWRRQVIVATHNANIPVNGDAERVVVLENEGGALRVRTTVAAEGGEARARIHAGAIEKREVREDIQNIMEGGIAAFVQRERKYNNEVSAFRKP